jgi:KDO2-lipid IV(A) lauroyltransferase
VNRRAVAHALEYGLFRLLAGSLKLLPDRVGDALGMSLGWLAGVVLRIRRNDVDTHLRIAFPDKSAEWRARVARACYLHLGREAAATFRLAGLDAPAIVDSTEVIGLDAFREAAEAGHGVVLVTGHVGNWEIGGAAFAARGFPIDVVAKGMANRRFEEALNANRERLGMRVVDMTRAHRQGPRSLRAGRVLGFVADQDARGGGVFVPFFGRLASTARGPALFALRSGAPLFVGACLRTPGRGTRYRVTVERVEAPRTGGLRDAVLELTRSHVAVLERAVAAAPAQYFWHHKRWKTRPPEEPPPPAPV